MEATKEDIRAASRPFRRTGLAKGLIDLPDDFAEHFNDMDTEIAAMFSENVCHSYLDVFRGDHV